MAAVPCDQRTGTAAMRETSEELSELQRLLDWSLAGSSEHLQSIVPREQWALRS